MSGLLKIVHLETTYATGLKLVFIFASYFFITFSHLRCPSCCVGSGPCLRLLIIA